jgi:hypothetical protein
MKMLRPCAWQVVLTINAATTVTMYRMVASPLPR